MEWAVKDGVPYAIDFMNPAPDMDIYSLTPHYFEWAIKAMADMAIRLAKNPRPLARDLRWDALFTGTRHYAAAGGAHIPDGGRSDEGTPAPEPTLDAAAESTSGTDGGTDRGILLGGGGRGAEGGSTGTTSGNGGGETA
jgi:hypothetical protein